MPFKESDILNAMDGNETATETDAMAGNAIDGTDDAQDAPQTGKKPETADNLDDAVLEILEARGVDESNDNAKDSAGYAARVDETGEHYTPSIASQDMVSRMVAGELDDGETDAPTQVEIDRAQALESARYQEWLTGGDPTEQPLATARGMAEVLKDSPVNSQRAADARGLLLRIANNADNPAEARTIAANTLKAYPAPSAPTVAGIHDNSTRVGYVRALVDSAGSFYGSQRHAEIMNELRTIANDEAEAVEVRNVARKECQLEPLPANATRSAERPARFAGDAPVAFELPWNEYESLVLHSFKTPAEIQDWFTAYRTHHNITV